MKINLQTIFYLLAIVALILTIIQIIDNLMDDDEDEDKTQTVVYPETQYVVMPWVRRYRPYWWRFRRNVPWVGPRPGGGWVGRIGRRGRRHGGGRRGGRRRR
jgi:hypothetical protein